ncbi:hypothetical protein HC928_25280 [bacterium]|nr:hypothetical protein [bacterium]
MALHSVTGPFLKRSAIALAWVYYTDALAVRRHSGLRSPTVTTMDAIAQVSLQQAHQLPL